MLTDILCTRCGLCCDGTLLGDVELTGPAEAARLELLGLDVDGDDADAELLSLPCAALCGTRCGIYTQRPRSCRTFECRLLQDTRRGIVSVDAALARIARARAQVQRVKALLAREEILPGPAAARGALRRGVRRVDRRFPAAARRRHQLEAAMAVVARTIRTTFLG